MRIFGPGRDPVLPIARRGGGPLVESYFLKANAPDRREAIWVKYTFLLDPGREGRGRASVWAIHFDGQRGTQRALKESWPLGSVSWEEDRLAIEFGDSALDRGHARGRLADGRGGISWDLSLEDEGPALSLLTPLLAKAPFPKQKLSSPMPDASVTGRMVVDGTEIPVEGWRGMLGHNWGPRHGHRYAWAHCNTFDGEKGTVFEGVCAGLPIGGRRTPLLSSVTLRRHGRHYDLHDITSVRRRRSDLGWYRWFFSVHEPPVRLEGVFQASREDVVGLYYDNPDGTMTYCLNSKLAHVRLFLFEDGLPDVTLASQSAALEIGTADPHHGARMMT